MKIAFVGAGRIAESHMHVLDAHRDRFPLTVCGAYSPSGVSAQQFTSRWGGKAFPNVESLLDQPGLDAVYIVSPTPFHVEQARAVAERGIPLFLEKPPALDVAGTTMVREAIRSAGVLHCVGLNWRYRELVLKMKELLQNAGGPALMTVRWFWFTPPVAWLRDRTKSGGQVLDQLIHVVDLFHFLAGPADRVSALYADGRSAEYNDFTNWDVHALQIHFSNGCIGNIVSTYKLNVGMTDPVEIEVVADNLRLRLTDRELYVYDGPTCTIYRESGDTRMEMLGRVEIEKAFLEAVTTNRPDGIRTTIDDALTAMKTIGAANEAASTERVVKVERSG